LTKDKQINEKNGNVPIEMDLSIGPTSTKTLKTILRRFNTSQNSNFKKGFNSSLKAHKNIAGGSQGFIRSHYEHLFGYLYLIFTVIINVLEFLSLSRDPFKNFKIILYSSK
jgi:hypothetical protein